MQYRTSIPVRPAVTLGGLLAPPSHVDQDVYNGLIGRVQSDLDRQAQNANAQHMRQAANTQAQMATRGLQQMAQGRQNQMNLADSRREAAGSYMNNLLRDLFR